MRAVTFDFWDTLVVDDSDEPVRASLGLADKVTTRAALFVAEVLAHSDRSEADARDAWQRALATFRHQWKVEHHTPHVRERVADALRHLGLAATPGTPALIEQLAWMEVEIPPRLCDGTAAMLTTLKARGWKVGIISDTITTPGDGLRAILRQYDLLHLIDHAVFSDEVGASKPSPTVFRAAANGLQVSPSTLLHVGDREANDIAGPHTVGARGVLYVGAIDRRDGPTTADAVCAHHDDLPSLLEHLAGAAA